MELIERKCIYCGKKMRFNPEENKITCGFCGAEMTFDDGILKNVAYAKEDPDKKTPGSDSAAEYVAQMQEKEKFDWRKELRDWLIIIVSAVILAWAVTHFVVMKTEVVSESMVATLNKGDRIIANRLAYMFSSPKRGDIVFFPFPDDTTEEPEIFVKRIIGLPGEKVEIIDGRVYINDSKTPLEEDYLYEIPDDEDCGPFNVPENCYFMMGDNRNISHDARYWENTYVSKDKIVAKAWLRYRPGVHFYSRPDYGEQ